MQQMKKLLIYGSKELGQVLKNLSEKCGHQFAGFIDDFNTNVPDVVGSFNDVREKFDPEHYSIAIAVGYKHILQRRKIFERVRDASFETPSLIHPNLYLDSSAVIGTGVIAMSACIIDYRAHIGDFAVIWPGTIINHDVIVGSNVFLSPGSVVCGYCRIGEDSFIGASTTIVDHITVPKNTFLRAGTIYYKQE